MEDKVTYKDGQVIRALRGIVISQDDTWIVVKRRDGTVSLKMSEVLKIERGIQ
jgi:hypothetical protein